ncbi:hypothetical protein [Marinitoga sp. 1155]|uniref:hypothetical protein n=1 Tax=Marinitoga sp. 1155 TaxID=1428448 RepID=UPI000641382D|nr:hypothetical protein [Marinitoga sp. 1155]KLO24680.1 hypothetical protein X274_02965 [Marinitoga sp. 1155]
MKKIFFNFFVLFFVVLTFSQNISFKNFNTYYIEHKIGWNFDISYDGSILYYLEFKNEEIQTDMTFITEYKDVLISGEKKGYIYYLKVVAKNIDRNILGESKIATLVVFDNEEEPLRIIGAKVVKTEEKKYIHFVLRNVSSKTIREFKIRYWGIDYSGKAIRINRKSYLKYEEKNIEIKPFDFYNVDIEIQDAELLRFVKGKIWEIIFDDDSEWKRIIE